MDPKSAELLTQLFPDARTFSARQSRPVAEQT